MSKKLEATITCPHCGREYPATLYRTIWGEYEENRSMVMEDKINVLTCPHCQFSFKAPFALMYVDIKANFAVWWMPHNDPQVEEDTVAYKKMFGERSFYATAPRIQDWEEFKQTVNRYYSGELVGGPVEKLDLGSSFNKKGGCLGVAVLLMMSFVGLYVFL